MVPVGVVVDVTTSQLQAHVLAIVIESGVLMFHSDASSTALSSHSPGLPDFSLSQIYAGHLYSWLTVPVKICLTNTFRPPWGPLLQRRDSNFNMVCAMHFYLLGPSLR